MTYTIAWLTSISNYEMKLGVDQWQLSIHVSNRSLRYFGHWSITSNFENYVQTAPYDKTY
jgi:hypothetical protein